MTTIVECRSEVQESEASVSNAVEEEIAHQQGNPIGYIYHRTSFKAIHPKGGSPYPDDNTDLVVHDGSNEHRLQLQFVPQPAFGHFGYIKHVASGKYIHPNGGSGTPGDNTHLVFHHGAHYGCLFKFDEEKEHIIHIGEKIWHPLGGDTRPGNNNPVVLHSGSHAATRFYFGDGYGNKISPYTDPFLGGDWVIVKAFINPQAAHTYTERYLVGRSYSSTVTVHHAWSVSASAAYDAFSASATYSGFVERSHTDTWNEEHETTTQISVEPGVTVVVWQYVFTMERYNENLIFQSDILGDTNSIYVKPTLGTATRQSTL